MVVLNSVLALVAAGHLWTIYRLGVISADIRHIQQRLSKLEMHL